MTERRPWHRWMLVATPADPESELLRAMADGWNEDPQLFVLRRSAANAVWFYEERLELPVRFWIRRIGELDGRL